MDSRTPPHLAKQPSFFADTSPPPCAEISTPAAPATPLTSRKHKGPHRDGFSVKKCRDVLVRQCSWIPRNYNFKDGVNQVYEVLREYLGDENLDLAIAQLNELIEVPSQWPHDEGASFQSWKHDYMLRHKDLENSHVPRLRNVIVAPINPTERLRKWREDHPDRDRGNLWSSQSSQTPSSISEVRPITPDYRIGTRARGGNWRLENALFVSSRAQGTRVVHCPSPQELHKKTWNEDFGRGGKLVQERIVNPGEPVDAVEHTPDQVLPLKRQKSFADLRSMRSFGNVPVLKRIESINFAPDKLNTCMSRQLSVRGRGWPPKQSNKRKAEVRAKIYHSDPLLGRFAVEVKIYEGNPAVRDLPDPDSDNGKLYYSNILTWPLPLGMSVPSPRFARKHSLVPEEIPLSGGVVIKLVPTADEVAIEKNFPDAVGSQSLRSATDLSGPFTPELFKDSGIDFPPQWGNTNYVPADNRFELEMLSDMGTFGDAAQSPSKHPQCISEDIQVSSSISVSIRPEKEHQIYIPNRLACHPLKSCRIGPAASAPKSMVSYRRQWHRFTWKRYAEGTFSGAAPATSVPLEPRSPPTHSLTDLTKTFRQTLSESSHPQYDANLTFASLSMDHHSLDLLSPLGQCHLGSTAAGPPTNCAIMEPANITQRPNMTLRRNCSLAGNEIEAEKNELNLLKGIPEIAVNPLAGGSTEHSTKTYDSERVPTSQRRQRYETALLKTGNGLQVEPASNILDPKKVKKHGDGTSTVDLALGLLQKTGYLHSEAMLNCGSSGAKTYTRVLNKNKMDSLRNRENNKSKLTTGNSLRTTPAFSLTLTHRSSGLNHRCSDLQEESGMDLNRDLPPLPLATDSQSLQFGDQSQQHNLELQADYTLELLQPLCYDPVRDSMKYGGLHYHPDGMRYHPEIPQHPPRTSSMPQSGTSIEATGGLMHHSVVTREHLHHQNAANKGPQDVCGPNRVCDASYGSEGSSGIMGNFIPVKTVPSSSVIVARAVHLPRIETDHFTAATGRKFQPKPTHEKGSLQDSTGSQKTLEKIGSSKIKYPYGLYIRRGFGVSRLPTNDHDSIDLNDPEALEKYLRQLKKMKKQATDATEKLLGPDYSLSSNFDGEAGRYIDCNDEDDYTVVDSDDDAGAPHFTPQDYSEIRAGNPFEFELDIQNDPDRITTFTDFMGGMNNWYEGPNIRQSRKKGHKKNSHSESNAFYMKKRPEPIQIVEQTNALRQVLQRSDSSPNISPMRIPARRGTAHPSAQSSYEEDDRSNYLNINRSQGADNLPRSPIRHHGFRGSSSKQLGDVLENQETTFDTPSPNQKRPWSPVKMIFGERGWLSSTASPKKESTTPKKPGLVEKIKLKMEEIGLKADLSPTKNPFRNNQEKSWEQSTFPISLNPAQQAELYLDIELLICDSANTFLMNEYHNNRMSVDSLKKTTDFWKSKGRPQVLEFHYDQSTQRDLIVANQKTFRFYGPNANDPLKVHAMLYAWKNNAREMAVRTFCYPDSMIRKHVQDAFVILDFLGGHPFQYIAAHEVQKKLVRWIDEAISATATRCSGPLGIQKVGFRSNESPTELVTQNPWHSASKPIKRPNKQSSGSQLTT